MSGEGSLIFQEPAQCLDYSKGSIDSSGMTKCGTININKRSNIPSMSLKGAHLSIFSFLLKSLKRISVMQKRENENMS